MGDWALELRGERGVSDQILEVWSRTSTGKGDALYSRDERGWRSASGRRQCQATRKWVLKYNSADSAEITAKQQELLADVYGDASTVPQMWAIYKEVMGYYADGVSAALGTSLRTAVCTARRLCNAGRR